MSKVYEALKKAEREGRWRDSIDAAQPRSTQERLISPSEHSDSGSSNGPWRDSAEIHRDRQLDPTLTRANTGPALIMHQESLSRAGEQFHFLRANLESWAVEHDKRVILITSALPGEGKSFVALNLAIALSDAGSHVLLIDADLRAPSLHRSFNLAPLNGLLPYLEGRTDFIESITPTSSPRLSLLAATGVTLSGPEAFASSRMRELVNGARELKPRHFVLIDAPAALVGPEAQILSRLVDTALVVVGANDAPRAAVTRTLEMIKGVPLFGIVLNRFRPPYSAARSLRYRSARYGSDNEG